jgi:hypothetical protein
MMIRTGILVVVTVVVVVAVVTVVTFAPQRLLVLYDFA